MKGAGIAQTINLIYLENSGFIQYDERRILYEKNDEARRKNRQINIENLVRRKE